MFAFGAGVFARRWRLDKEGRLNIHPVADLFPMLTDEELDVLAEDIQANGLRNPIVTYEDQVLDGRNRLAACERVGVEPTHVEYEGDDPIAFIVSQNLQRRHLTAGQRAAIGVGLLPPLEEEARQRHYFRQGEDGRIKDTDPSINDSVSSDGYYRDINNRSSVQAGNLVGVSGNSIILAKRLYTQGPDLFDEVKSGELSLNRAVMILQQRQAGLVDMAPPAARRRDTAAVEDRDEPILRQDEDVTRIPAWQIADAVGALLRYAKSDMYWDLPETVSGWNSFGDLLQEFYDVALPRLDEYAKTITERRVA